jgi:ornithine cyclodeaminase
VKFLSESDIRAAISGPRAIALMESAFREYLPQAIVPERLHMTVPQRGTLLLMPCAVPALDSMGFKSAFVLDRAIAAGESVKASYVLLDSRGELRATMEARHLTAFRTAAVSALATKFLARPESSTLGIFGTGRLAASHAELIPCVRPVREVRVCGTSLVKSAKFAQQISSELKIFAHAASPQDTAACDIVCACTNSAQPVLQGEWLRPGAHLNLVGSFRPTVQEVDDDAVVRASVFVDTMEGALSEAGDLLVPINKGLITQEHIRCDLRALVAGAQPGRRSPLEITLFKSVGHAIEDLVMAHALVQGSDSAHES